MEADRAWILTFVDGHTKNTVPLRSRVNALLKIALRRLGLRCTADVPLRRLVLEEHCCVLCQDCAEGQRVKCDDDGHWWHPKTGHLCGARQLREWDKQRRAKDAANGSVSLPTLPNAVERGGHD